MRHYRLLRRLGRLRGGLLRELYTPSRPLAGGLRRRDGARPFGDELAPDTDSRHENTHLIARLRPDAQPVQSPLLVDLDERWILEGMVLADVLDEATVAGASLVRDDHAVERTLVRSQPPQPDPRRHASSSSGEFRLSDRRVTSSSAGRWVLRRRPATSSCPARACRPSSSASSCGHPRSP